MSLGERYYDELDYDQAIAAYTEVLEIDPKNEEALYGIAESYEAKGEERQQNGEDYSEDYAAAQDYYEQAITYYPDSDRAEEAREEIAKIEGLLAGQAQEVSGQAQEENYELSDNPASITLTGTLVKADWSCPYAGLDLKIEDSSVIAYGGPDGSYEIVNPWGLLLDQPITLTVDGQPITISELGLSIYDTSTVLQENGQYTISGYIYDYYSLYIRQRVEYDIQVGAPVEFTDDHVRLREPYKYDIEVFENGQRYSEMYPFDYYFPFGHYSMMVMKMTEVK